MTQPTVSTHWRALFRKKWGPFTWGGRPCFFSGKKTGDLFSHHRPCVRCQFSSKTGDLFCSSLSFTRGEGQSPIISGMQEIAAPFVGALFCGAPVRPTCWTCLNPPLNRIQPNPGNPVPATGYPVPKPGNKSTHYFQQSVCHIPKTVLQQKPAQQGSGYKMFRFCAATLVIKTYSIFFN